MHTSLSIITYLLIAWFAYGIILRMDDGDEPGGIYFDVGVLLAALAWPLTFIVVLIALSIKKFPKQLCPHQMGYNLVHWLITPKAKPKVERVDNGFHRVKLADESRTAEQVEAEQEIEALLQDRYQR
jgi:hypothetical protein